MKLKTQNSKFKIQNSPPAFTLVELLVVVAIIVLLASILTPVISYALSLSKKRVCGVLITNVAQAVEQYKSDFGQPPESRIGRNPQATGYFANLNNIRYNDLTGAEILTEALTGHDNEVIQRPADNPPDGNPGSTFSMHANLAVGLGIRNIANLALQPVGAAGSKQTVAASDGSCQLAGQVYGPYFPVDKLVCSANVVTTATGNVNATFRRMIPDPYGGVLIYYKAQRPRFLNTTWRQSLFEQAGSPAGMDQRDTGVNRNNAAMPLYRVDQNYQETVKGLAAPLVYVRAPIFDLDHNYDVLNGTNPATGASYKSSWAGGSATDGLRRTLKGWDNGGAKTETQYDPGYLQFSQEGLQAQDYLIISAGADHVFGRAQAGNSPLADDVTNIPVSLTR